MTTTTRFRVFKGLLLSTVVTTVAACDAGSTAGPPEPTPSAAHIVTSGETEVAVTSLSPLVLTIRNGNGRGAVGVETADQTSQNGCEAFALGIRPRSDDGERYHDVEAPADDIEWFFAADATLLSDDDASEHTVALRFTSPESTREVDATLRLRPTGESFVAADLDFEVADGDVAMVQACFPLDGTTAAAPVEGAGYHVVGGGERFDGVDLYGRVIPLAFRAPARFDSGTNESHAPVPFFATDRGAAALIETERVGAFDVGLTHPGALIARFHGTSLPLRLRASDGVDQSTTESVNLQDSAIVKNVAAHNRYMGLPPPPPLWALAPQQWRNEHDVTVEDGRVTESGRDRLMADITKMRSSQIPGSLVWIDAPWSTGFNSFAFNEEQFPAPDAMFEEVQERGYRVIVWATEHINRSDDSPTLFGMPPFATLDLFNAFAEQGYFVKNTNGTPFTLSWGRGSGGFLDFTHPPAVDAWKELMRPLLEKGVRGFKLDYGESMRADLLGLGPNDAVTFADGTTTRVQHTRYQRLYHEAFLSALDDVWGADRFIITRTGGIYDQRNGVALWPGDLDNDFSLGGVANAEGVRSVGGLRGAISGGLSAAMSGYPLYGSDIGGYRGGPPTTEVLIRWAQFGALSTIMQLGGGGTGDQTHNPWDEELYDAERALPAYTAVARLHMDLLPYINALVHQASESGMPPLVPLGALAGDDDDWADIDSYFFGNALYVAPVVTAGVTSRRVRFPGGAWLDFATGEEHAGNSVAEVDAPFDVIPLFIRAGAVVPLLDPRVDTVVSADADPDAVDLDDLPPVMRLRTSAGPDDVVILADGTVLAQTTADGQTVVSIDGPVAKRWVVTLWLRDAIGPGADATIDGAASGTDEVTTETELLTCNTPCTFRDDRSIAVAVDGATFDVAFGQTD